MILYLASDLLWASKIKGTADALNLPCRPARTPEMLRARLADSPVRALIIDLEAGLTALDLLHLIRTEAPAVRTLAFAPHVLTDAINAAKDAGAHTVLPRSTFSAQLPALLTALSTGQNPTTTTRE